MNSAINPAIDINDEIDGRKWFHENIRDKDQLVITVGDSWTWGNSLGKIDADAGIIDDYEHRVTSIYGYHLANLLDCDFVNIGLPGVDNVSIINRTFAFINGIKKNYKKIYLIITLTENGRELSRKGFLEAKHEYNRLKGADWPSYADILANTATPDSIDVVLTEIADGRYGTELIDKLKLFLALNPSTSLTDFFVRYDKYISSIIKEQVANTNNNNLFCVVGRTYTLFAGKCVQEPNILYVTDLWVEIIAKNGKLDKFPARFVATFHMNIQHILRFINKIKLSVTTDELLSSLLQPADDMIDWCDKSPYNSKTASRHPNEQGHIWWAEHLYNCIITHQELSGLAT